MMHGMSSAEITLTFSQIVPSGKAMGRHEGMVVFALGILPGETARVRLVRMHRTYAEAELLEILKPSPHRITPHEDHFINCSPFQIADYDYQLQLKQSLLKEALAQQGIEIEAKIAPSLKQFAYRNKFTFSLTEINHRLTLALHQRGEHDLVIPVPDGCHLAHPTLNAAAGEVVMSLQKIGVPAASIETITVQLGGAGASGVVLVRKPGKWLAHTYLPPNLVGLKFIKSGSSRVLHQLGPDGLTDNINGLDIAYPLGGFFQTNLPLFAQALANMKTQITPGDRLLELYAGAGAISIYLAPSFKDVVCIESSPGAAEWVKLNARQNNINNVTGFEMLAEATPSELWLHLDTLIVDPPRAGLHPAVIDRILKYRPKQIMYLSCNPTTLARDISALKGQYRLQDVQGFDFYPQTPHIEALATLQLH